MRWTILIEALDDTDLREEIVFTNEEGHCYRTEGGVVVQTQPTGFGGYNMERLIPYSRLLSYTQESS